MTICILTPCVRRGTLGTWTVSKGGELVPLLAKEGLGEVETGLLHGAGISILAQPEAPLI